VPSSQHPDRRDGDGSPTLVGELAAAPRGTVAMLLLIGAASCQREMRGTTCRARPSR
jgi:hypothetical protein